MGGDACVAFLQSVLPRLGLRWAGYRRVRRTVCKRLRRRLRELELPDLAAYQARLDNDPAEIKRLDALCRIPISRFYRGRALFDALGSRFLPALAHRAEGGVLRCWSAGCASGEEPYTLSLIWHLRVMASFPAVSFEILASDADQVLLARARAARYGAGSLRDLPEAWRRCAFRSDRGAFDLHDAYRTAVAFVRQDLRRTMPTGPFDLVLCRNMAFTYFDAAGQRAVLEGLAKRTALGGLLVIGDHERLPNEAGFEQVDKGLPVFRR